MRAHPGLPRALPATGIPGTIGAHMAGARGVDRLRCPRVLWAWRGRPASARLDPALHVAAALPSGFLRDVGLPRHDAAWHGGHDASVLTRFSGQLTMADDVAASIACPAPVEASSWPGKGTTLAAHSGLADEDPERGQVVRYGATVQLANLRAALGSVGGRMVPTILVPELLVGLLPRRSALTGVLILTLLGPAFLMARGQSSSSASSLLAALPAFADAAIGVAVSQRARRGIRRVSSK